MKKDIKNEGVMLSRGFGFVEFEKREDAVNALKFLQSKMLDGHALTMKFSEKSSVAGENTNRKRKTRLKIQLQVIN